MSSQKRFLEFTILTIFGGIVAWAVLVAVMEFLFGIFVKLVTWLTS